jgi:hypothetical protein
MTRFHGKDRRNSVSVAMQYIAPRGFLNVFAFLGGRDGRVLYHRNLGWIAETQRRTMVGTIGNLHREQSAHVGQCFAQELTIQEPAETRWELRVAIRESWQIGAARSFSSGSIFLDIQPPAEMRSLLAAAAVWHVENASPWP